MVWELFKETSGKFVKVGEFDDQKPEPSRDAIEAEMQRRQETEGGCWAAELKG